MMPNNAPLRCILQLFANVSAITLTMILATANAWAADEDNTKKQVRVIEPDKRVVEAKAAIIDTERFELGFYLGNLSVEDFGSNVVNGVELSYHINERWLAQVNYGQANIDRAAFETSQLQFLASEDRDFIYYAITGGYRFLKGRSFLGARNKYDSELYVIAGPEHVDFASNSEVGLHFGLSYRFVFTDWLTANVDFREHFFERSFIGDTKKTLNTELRFGVNALF